MINNLVRPVLDALFALLDGIEEHMIEILDAEEAAGTLTPEVAALHLADVKRTDIEIRQYKFGSEVLAGEVLERLERHIKKFEDRLNPIINKERN
jgi:hypothetical protein